MPYIGNDIQFGELTSQTFTGDGSTVAFTMGYSVANTTSILVTSGNVVQEPTVAYTVSGTTLTFTSAPENADTIHVRYLGRTLDVSQTAIVQDTDQDTKIQVEESADEDTIRFDIAGAEDFTMTANDFTALSGSTISTNTIAETTAASGVTIDGALIKDSVITASINLGNETLGDYDEGTWTPTIVLTGTAFGALTYDGTTGGVYTRIGNKCFYQGFIRTDAITVGSASGTVNIGGLPFTVSNGSGNYAHAPFKTARCSNWAGDVPHGGYSSPATTVLCLQYRDAPDGADILLSYADLDTGTNDNDMQFAGSFQIA
jgi:hypothetical protein